MCGASVWGRYFLASVFAVAATGTAFATGTSYSIPQDDIAALLDDDFYNGLPGLYGSPTGTLRWAYLAAINNAGTQVVFIGLTFDPFPSTTHERMFIVDVGQPSSWREINQNENPPLITPVWSPNDEYITMGSHRINMDTGLQESSYYTFAEPLGLNLANAGTGLVTSYEFNTDGDLENWFENYNVTNLAVSGGTIHGTITGPDNQIAIGMPPATTTAGINYAVFRIKVTPDVSRAEGRFAWDYVDTTNGDYQYFNGPTGEWRTYILDLSSNAEWNTGPDLGAFIYWPCEDCTSGTFEVDFIRLFGGTGFPDHTGLPILDNGTLERDITVFSVTSKVGGNFASGVSSLALSLEDINNDGGTWDAYAFPIDDSLAPVNSTLNRLTNFPGNSVRVSGGVFSGDGTLMTLAELRPSTQPNVGPGHLSHQQDVYVLDGTLELSAGLAVPPTSFADPRFHALRTESETGSTRFQGLPLISPDKSIVVYASDFAVNTDSGTIGRWSGNAVSFTYADFDIMLSTPLGEDGPPVDSANISDDRQFPNPGSQYISSATKNGLRLIWQDQANIFAPLKIYIATFVQTTSIDAETDPLPPGPTNIGGEVVVLTDSAIVATVDTQVQDASGTSIVIPDGQIINFPEGSGATGITIFTPTSPVEQAQLPPDAPITAIPVQRSFGPEGTYFYPPVAITITYLDSEISTADEDTIVPYIYNPGTDMFEPVQDFPGCPITRDPANNRVTFCVDHFSTYALAINNPQQALVGIPAASGVGLAVLSGLMVAAYALRRRKV